MLCLAVLLGQVSGCGGASNPPAVETTSAPVGKAETRPAGAASKSTSKTPDDRRPSFRVLGRDAGIDFERMDDIRGQRRILEANGGGVAMFDFDGDGWLDLFFTNGCRLPLKEDDRSTRSELYRNLGDARFAKVTDPAQVRQFGYTHGCAVGDYDADGFDDLYVTAYGPNGFWRNNGDGTFDEVTEITGTRVGSWSASAAFSDVNGDEILDLYVTTYLNESDETPRECPNPRSPDGYEQCPPAKFEGLDDALFLGDGSGRFIDVSASSGIGGLRGKGLGVVICDFNRDRRPEIYVANDGEPNFLFVASSNTDADSGDLPGGTRPVHFEERGLASGVALNEAGFAQASMGIAAGDYDGNGTIDLFLTNFFGDTNTLYSNRGNLAFVDVTRATRLGPPSRNRLGWGTVFLDVDNDGWLDLFVANGHVDDRTWMAQGEPYRMQPLLHLNNRDGTYTDVSQRSGEYFQSSVLGRGVAMGDLDRDGRIDLAVSHQLSPSVALRNETERASSSLVIRLVGTHSNRNGYGASLEFETSEGVAVRDLVGGASFQSASALELHVGLGTAAVGSLKIRWPSGGEENHAEVSAGRWIAVEGRGLYRQGR